MSTIATTDLPGVLADIAEEAGSEAAIRLALACGGMTLHVPQASHIGASHMLAVAIGLDAARRMAVQFSGESLYVPKARRHIVRHLSARGMSARQIAGEIGLSLRAVQKYRQSFR